MQRAVPAVRELLGPESRAATASIFAFLHLRAVCLTVRSGPDLCYRFWVYGIWKYCAMNSFFISFQSSRMSMLRSTASCWR